MNKKKLAVPFVIFATFFFVLPVKAETYKWVDDKGILHLSDRPPSDPIYLKRIREYSNNKVGSNNTKENRPSSADESKVLLSDDFNDNSNNWSQRNDDNVNLSIDNGYYRIYARNEYRKTWRNSGGIDENYDFEIEATMTKVKGPNNYSYELIFGLKDNKHFFAFGVSGNGSYLFRQYDNTNKSIIGWARSQHINKHNSTNKLKVKKKGKELHFYLNDKFVDKTLFRPLFGEKIGFGVCKGIEVRVDKVTVKKIYN